MSKTYRSVNTRFWADTWVRRLNALDRYLFLYLITNDHVNWCGIYELDLGMMAFESGIDKEDLQRTMLPRLEPKIIYEEGWIFIQNYDRYHSGGANAEKGRIAAIEALPDRIKAKIKDIPADKWGKKNPLEGGSPSASTFTSTSTLSAEQSSEEKLIGEIIFLFKEVNPSYKTFFNRKPQREAARRLLKEHGMEKVKAIIAYLPHSNGMKYAPTITSPYVLEAKMGDLLAWSKKQKDSGKKVNIAFV